MKTIRLIPPTLLLLATCLCYPALSSGAESPAYIQNLMVPESGSMQILFHSKTAGPFRVETKQTVDSPDWVDCKAAVVTQVDTGSYLAMVPKGSEEVGFFRIVSETEVIAELKGWTILLNVSAPANGEFLAAGESATVTVRILDTLGQAISKDDFSTLNLYMYGPQDPQKTVTASKLLNVPTNRSVTGHHVVNLKTNPGVQAENNILTYKLQPLTDEAPGTYTVSVYAVRASDAIQQIMKFADVQVGTGVKEAQVVVKTACAACHEGPVSGKMYLHHIDRSGTSLGSWSRDFQPVTSCKSCHNNDGSAAYRDPSGTPIADPVIRRVHGVHMGEGLRNNANTNPVTGDFRHYTHIEFPAGIKNCTVCHVDDRWKTAPSRLACGSCHDNIWFGQRDQVPAGMWTHSGGVVSSDSRCANCHLPEGDLGIADAHAIPAVPFQNVVNLTMTPPANGKFYVNGEAPQVIIKVSAADTGAAIDPAKILEPKISTNIQAGEWKAASLFVSGPREQTKPVLTTASTPNPAGYYANNDLRVRLNPAKEDPKVTRTADSIVYQLNPIAGLAPGTYTAFAEVQPGSGLGGWAYVNFQVGSTNIEKLVAGNCTDCHRDNRMHQTAFAVTFTPDVCKSCHDYERQSPGKVGWANANNGFGAAPLARRVHGVHYGRYLDKPQEVHAKVDYSEVIFPQDVRNCTKCHSESTTWNEQPSRLACLACHDTDEAIAHGNVMTLDPSPQDPWSGDEIETCVVCHDQDGAYAPSKVHAISNPFVPPYIREP